MRAALRGLTLVLLVSACAAGQGEPATRAELLPALSRPAASPDVLRGESLLAEGNAPAAKQVFEKALADNPRDPRAWLDLGLALEETEDWLEAERAYRRSVELDPGFAEAFNNLGVLLRERGALDEAVAALERAVALDPALTAARFNLAMSYEELERPGEAEREYLGTIERLPRDPIPRINLAMLYLETGRPEAAAAQLREARPIARGDTLLSIALGEGFRRAGLSEDAVSILEMALRQASSPPPTELLAELALAYYANGEIGLAEKTMRQALGQAERDPALHYAYGSILAKQGQLGKARAHLRRCVDLDPNGPYAERARARLDGLKKN